MLPQKVEMIIQSVRHLRPMPSNVTRILKEIDNPDIKVTYISEYVSLDQALAALVMQMSNSASLGYGQSCVSIHEAVIRIGLKRLKSILLASPAFDALNQRLSGYRLGSGELWHHSLATAVASEWLARALGYDNTEEAYVSGLLHDLGKLLLDQYILNDYGQMVEYVQRYKIPLWKVEEKLIGVDHARVGGLIAERWDFPVGLADTIRCHHYPSLARANQKLAAIVNLANSVASQISITDQELFSNEIHPESYHLLNLVPEEFDKMKTRLLTMMTSI